QMVVAEGADGRRKMGVQNLEGSRYRAEVRGDNRRDGGRDPHRCQADDGSWSYIGTDILKYQDLGRTMNYGWDLTTIWGHATALHEIGHTLGLPHEHQNPGAGIVWNEPKVYAYFSGPPDNWDHDTIFSNIIKKLRESDVEGSRWDPQSIMHYPFEPGLI